MKGQMFTASDFVLPITSNVANPDIRSLATAAGWNGANKLVVDITAALVNGLNVSGSYPRGLLLKISAGTLVGGVKNGGTAITTSTAITIENNGKIYGGGGLGGRGGTGQFGYRGGSITFVFGGTQGDGQGFPNSSATTPVASTSGGSGDYAIYGGATFGDAPPYGYGGDGGNGGAWGAPGGNGGLSSVGGAADPIYTELGDAGGAAGFYVNGNGYVTWTATGDRRGRVT